MLKLYTIISAIFLLNIAATAQSRNDSFTVNAKVTGLSTGTPVMILDASNNGIIDSTSIVNDRFAFSGTTTQEPKSFIIYIPLESGVKYAYVFMANETVTVKGDLSDFPNNLTVEGSVHHKLKQDYDKSLVSFDKQMNAKNIENERT